MKLLLRSAAGYTVKNATGKTPLDLAKEEQNAVLVELVCLDTFLCNYANNFFDCI